MSRSGSAIVYAQLAVYVHRVLANRSRREYEPLGDFQVRQPLGQQDEHVDLAVRQRLY